MYECGQCVLVHNLISSTHIEVNDLDGVPPPLLLGTDENTGDSDAVATTKLVKGHHVQAVQITCPDKPAPIKSPLSVPIEVKPEPSPFPAPAVDDPIQVNCAQVHNLLIGAVVEIRDKASGNLLSSGIATSANNYFLVNQPNSGHVLVTQSLCNSSPAVEVSVTNTLATPVLGAPICEDSHTVSVDNILPTANVVIIRNGDWTHPIGYGSGSLGKGVVLHAHDKITAIQYIGNVISPPSNEVEVGCNSSPNVVTQHNNNARTGAYLAETTLTPARVKARGMSVKYTKSMMGVFWAQPLYVRRVAFENGGANGLFLTSLSDTVYALDADSGTEKWHTDLKDSDPVKRPNALAIAAAPVIDVAGQRMYVVFGTRTREDVTPPALYADVAYWLVTLDIRSGKELARTQISASVFDANGDTIPFSARHHNQHVALLLDHGSVYVAFCALADHEVYDNYNYHGWEMRYRATDLAFQGVFCTSKTSQASGRAGIWQGGGGLTADPDGNIYLLTGNGETDAAHEKYGDCFIKLVPVPTGMIPIVFVPDHTQDMQINDADFGSGGAMTIPGTNLVIGGGKPGLMYLLNRSSMTLVQILTAATNQDSPASRWGAWYTGPHLHGSPTYWRGADPTFGNLYVWGEKDVLRQFRFNTKTGKFGANAFHKQNILALKDTMPAGMISVSANGNVDNTGIVWATLPAKADERDTHEVKPVLASRFYAFDAKTLQWLWDVGYNKEGHWVPPTVANGMVFIASGDLLTVYTLGAEDGSQRVQGRAFQPRSSP